MDTIRVVCPSDNHPFKVSAKLSGRTIACPHCRTRFVAVHIEPTEPHAPSPAPLPWYDLLLFAGMGLILLVGLVYWALRWGLGIDLLPP
jgi:hypothetical protein